MGQQRSLSQVLRCPNAARTASRIAITALVPRRRRILPHVQLDPIGDVDRDARSSRASSSARIARSVLRRPEGSAKCCRNSPLERVTRAVGHLASDDLERRPFALTNLDRQQLQQMAIAVGRCRPRPSGPVEQAVRDVKSYRPGARRRSRCRARRPHAGRVDKCGRMTRQATRIPRRVPRVHTEQGYRRVGHETARYPRGGARTPSLRRQIPANATDRVSDRAHPSCRLCRRPSRRPCLAALRSQRASCLPLLHRLFRWLGRLRR